MRIWLAQDTYTVERVSPKTPRITSIGHEVEYGIFIEPKRAIATIITSKIYLPSS
jgi:hypothetical protein